MLRFVGKAVLAKINTHNTAYYYDNANKRGSFIALILFVIEWPGALFIISKSRDFLRISLNTICTGTTPLLIIRLSGLKQHPSIT